jgi:ribosomal protein L44E
MSNTEILVVWQDPKDGSRFYNKIVGFEGTLQEAMQFARDHNFGGGVETRVPKVKVLKFTCPKCGYHSLGSVEDVQRTYPIKRITEDGDLDYDHDMVEDGDGTVICYSCRDCGYELVDEEGCRIEDPIELVEWIKKNCPQDGPSDFSFVI